MNRKSVFLFFGLLIIWEFFKYLFLAVVALSDIPGVSRENDKLIILLLALSGQPLTTMILVDRMLNPGTSSLMDRFYVFSKIPGLSILIIAILAGGFFASGLKSEPSFIYTLLIILGLDVAFLLSDAYYWRKKI